MQFTVNVYIFKLMRNVNLFRDEMNQFLFFKRKSLKSKNMQL